MGAAAGKLEDISSKVHQTRLALEKLNGVPKQIDKILEQTKEVSKIGNEAATNCKKVDEQVFQIQEPIKKLSEFKNKIPSGRLFG